MYCKLPKFQVKKPALSLGTKNDVWVLTHLVTIWWHWSDIQTAENFFSMRPQTVSCQVPSNYVPPCAHTNGYLSVPPSELPGMRNFNQLLHKSQYSFFFLPKSPLVSQRWPILPLPQLIEGTHARIAQPHETLNLSQVRWMRFQYYMTWIIANS